MEPMLKIPEVNIVSREPVIVTSIAEWIVEQIDSDGDGGIDQAIFTGPNARVRAEEYADRLRLGFGAITASLPEPRGTV